MAAHLIQFVDSISATATVRLDVSGGAWTCLDMDAPPPRIRRAASSNAMRDGIFVSSSSYDARTLTLSLMLKTTTQDANATALQLLARELDRPFNYLKYQPDGMTKPVFFILSRSDMSALREVPTQGAAQRMFTIELLAEPFALGIKELISVGMVDSDPAGGSNGCYADVTGVIGDVPADCLIRFGRSVTAELTTVGAAIIGVRQHGTPTDLSFFKQAESCTLITDTTNPGGGPDAAMSGAGTNNFVRTSFATATMQTRLTWLPDDSTVSAAKGRAIRGTYRLVAAVRRSGATSVINVRAYQGSTPVGSNSVTLPLTSSRQLVDLGLVSFGMVARTGDDATADNGVDITGMSQLIGIRAERTSGAETLDWDALFLVPADEGLLMWSGLATITSAFASCDTIADGPQNCVRLDSASTELDSPTTAVTGGFPRLVPNQTNRFVILKAAAFNNASKTFLSTSGGTGHYVRFEYNPRYLYVRPIAT